MTTDILYHSIDTERKSYYFGTRLVDLFECVFTHSPVAICLEVYTSVKLLRCMMEVLYSSLSAPHYYLGHAKVF